MPLVGTGKQRILVIGEAPGKTEDLQGRPFVGEAGQLLRKYLTKLKLNLDDCWITNSIICRPPNNVMDPSYAKHCAPALLTNIASVSPRVILLLGKYATSSVVGQEWRNSFDSFERWVGWRIPSQRFSAWLCPTYHPSYLLRMNEDITLSRMFTEHLKQALRLRSKPVPVRPAAEDCVEILRTTQQAKEKLLWLLAQKGRLAFDYETTTLKPEAKEARLLCVSFCFEGEPAFSMLLNDDLFPLLSQVLKRRELAKIASNMKFEERWTRKWLRHGVVNWFWDTLLAAHFLDARPRTAGLKFQAYVRLGVAGYDNAATDVVTWDFDRLDPTSLLVYCGMDSYLTYHVAMQQIEEYDQEVSRKRLSGTLEAIRYR